MTSLFSNTMSPAKDGCSSLPRRPSTLSKPPLRALYDLLIAPMEGVSICPHDQFVRGVCVFERRGGGRERGRGSVYTIVIIILILISPCPGPDALQWSRG